MPRSIKYVNLDDIVKADRNPKKHDLPAIMRSMRHFGFTAPVIIDERTGKLVAGHGRTQALINIRSLGEPPPDGVEMDATGLWAVPVVQGWASTTDAQAEALIVADNHLTVKGGWDADELLELLKDLEDNDPLSYVATDFTHEDLDALLKQNPVEILENELDETPDDIDETPAIPVEYIPVTKPGDVWVLGKHKVICGDSSNPETFTNLLGDTRIDCVWTDPPYGVAYDSVDYSRRKKIANDSGPSQIDSVVRPVFLNLKDYLKNNANAYIAVPSGKLYCTFVDILNNSDLRLLQQLVWVKSSFAIGRNDYHYQHESILYARVQSKDKKSHGRMSNDKLGWYGGNNQTTVFNIDKPRSSNLHPTMKPVDLIRPMLANSCVGGGVVCDPFGGSGSTLLAAHLEGMRARLIELEPQFVDVICYRYQQLIGEQPTRDGVAYDFSTIT